MKLDLQYLRSLKSFLVTLTYYSASNAVIIVVIRSKVFSFVNFLLCDVLIVHYI